MRPVAADLQIGEAGMRIDRFGAVASTLCAIHCAVTALLPAAFGVLGLGFLLTHQAEWVFTLIAVAFAIGALALGWRRHRSTRVAAWFLLGIVGLLASRGLESGSMHHEHHDDRQHMEEQYAAPPEDGAPPLHGRHHAEHPATSRSSVAIPDEVSHIAGTAVGVLAGIILLVGHILNLRSSRRSFGESA